MIDKTDCFVFTEESSDYEDDLGPARAYNATPWERMSELKTVIVWIDDSFWLPVLVLPLTSMYDAVFL